MSVREYVHPKCGQTIRQRGNKTGHCPKCCQTFEGQSLFDAHQRSARDGSIICLDPAHMKFRGERVRLVDGSWRGPEFKGAAALYAKDED